MSDIFVQSISRGYMPGFCALLCQLRDLGHEEEVHVLYYSDLKRSEVERVAERSEYIGGVVIVSLARMREADPVEIVSANGGAYRGWDTRFYRYLYAHRHLSENGGAIFFVDGDFILLQNVSLYFKMARCGAIVVSTNPGHSPHLSREYCLRTNSDTKGPKYTDLPVVSSNPELMRTVWSLGQSEKRVLERGRGDMLCLSKAILEGNLDADVLVEPYYRWVHPWRSRPGLRRRRDGLFGFPDGDTIRAMHGKLWSKGHIDGQIRKFKPDEGTQKVMWAVHRKYLDSMDKVGWEMKK